MKSRILRERRAPINLTNSTNQTNKTNETIMDYRKRVKEYYEMTEKEVGVNTDSAFDQVKNGRQNLRQGGINILKFNANPMI